MVIEFDAAKNRANIAKHGLSLELAAEFTYALTVPAQTVRGEARYKMIGYVSVGLVSAIVTPRGANVRVISLRSASRSERKLYDEEN